MQHRILASLLAALFLLVAASASANSPHRYSPKHGAKCHKGYRRAKHHGHVYCVRSHKRRKSAAKAPEKVRLHAHLDPTYTRNPLDPFEVTYAYSASATQEPAARSASISTEEPAPLPKGVLSFYSDGILECSINVGANATGDECSVDYQALGVHKVTTLYTAGEESATVTETENIGPVGTQTTLSLTYTPRAADASGGWHWIGDLTVSWGAQPAAAHAQLGCGEEPTGANSVTTSSSCYLLTAQDTHVYGWSDGCSSTRPDGIRISADPPAPTDPATQWPSTEAIEGGVLHIRASVNGMSIENAGYASSEATIPLKFTTELTPTC